MRNRLICNHALVAYHSLFPIRKVRLAADDYVSTVNRAAFTKLTTVAIIYM